MILTLGHAALAKDPEPAPFEYDWQPLDPSGSALVTWEEVESACACAAAGPEVSAACDDPTAPLPNVAQVRAAADCVSVDFGPSRQRSATLGAWVDPSTAFVGLADFLVDRADRELRAYALREAGEALCAGEPELLPETCAWLRSDDTILSTGLGVVRLAVEADLRSLPRHAALRELPDSDEAKRDVLLSIAVAGRTAELGLQGIDPLVGLAGWAAAHPPDTLDCATPSTLAAYTTSVALATHGLRDGRLDPGGDVHAHAYALALAINLRERGVDWAACHPPLAVHPADPAWLGAALSGFSEREPATRLLLASAAAAPRGSAAPAGVAAAAAVVDAADEGDWTGIVAAMMRLSAVLAGPGEPREWARTVSFVGAVLGSEDAEATQAAIEAWAAPLGSYARKHEGTGRYAVVQAYVGLSGGVSTSADAATRPGLAAAPFAPVGVELGWKGETSFGVLVSVVDVGQVAAWRVATAGSDSAESASNDPEVRWSDVFAPGAWTVVSPCSAPIAIGAGVGLSPDALVVGPSAEAQDALRGGLFIAVDIPLFP